MLEPEADGRVETEPDAAGVGAKERRGGGAGHWGAAGGAWSRVPGGGRSRGAAGAGAENRRDGGRSRNGAVQWRLAWMLQAREHAVGRDKASRGGMQKPARYVEEAWCSREGGWCRHEAEGPVSERSGGGRSRYEAEAIPEPVTRRRRQVPRRTRRGGSRLGGRAARRKGDGRRRGAGGGA